MIRSKCRCHNSFIVSMIKSNEKRINLVVLLLIFGLLIVFLLFIYIFVLFLISRLMYFFLLLFGKCFWYMFFLSQGLSISVRFFFSLFINIAKIALWCILLFYSVKWIKKKIEKKNINKIFVFKLNASIFMYTQ